MDGDGVTGAEASGSQQEGPERQRSTIGFPYIGLKEAVDLANAIYENVGSGGCEDDQLAVWLASSPKSSGFRVRLTASRLFGLIETDHGQHTLTSLGLGIVDPKRETEAKIDAFLNVPLFRVLFENWRGRALPPTAALEREIVSLGVAEKQKDRARQTLERSAEFAGFFENGRDRLVKPGLPQGDNTHDRQDHHGENVGGGGGDKPPLDPVLKSLVDRLPPSGAAWGEDDRKLWLSLFENSFKLVYRDKPRELTDESRTPSIGMGDRVNTR